MTAPGFETPDTGPERRVGRHEGWASARLSRGYAGGQAQFPRFSLDGRQQCGFEGHRPELQVATSMAARDVSLCQKMKAKVAFMEDLGRLLG